MPRRPSRSRRDSERDRAGADTRFRPAPIGIEPLGRARRACCSSTPRIRRAARSPGRRPRSQSNSFSFFTSSHGERTARRENALGFSERKFKQVACLLLESGGEKAKWERTMGNGESEWGWEGEWGTE